MMMMMSNYREDRTRLLICSSYLSTVNCHRLSPSVIYFDCYILVNRRWWLCRSRRSDAAVWPATREVSASAAPRCGVRLRREWPVWVRATTAERAWSPSGPMLWPAIAVSVRPATLETTVRSSWTSARPTRV